MSDLTKRRPEFTTSIRGYDRLQVDDYIERLHTLVTYAEQRAREAESELELRDAESEVELSRHAGIGPRVSEIIDLAVAESQELRERVKRQTDTLFVRARREAEGIVESAHAEAAEKREEVQRERQEILTRLEAERLRAHAEIAELQRRKSEMLASLRQMQQALGAAVEMLPEHDPAERGAAGPERRRQRSGGEDVFASLAGEQGDACFESDEGSDSIVPLRVLAR